MDELEGLKRPPMWRKPELVPEQMTLSFSSPNERPQRLGINGRVKFVRLSPPEYQVLWLLHSYWGKRIPTEKIKAFATKADGDEMSQLGNLLYKVENKLEEATGGEVIINLPNSKKMYRQMMLNPDFRPDNAPPSPADEEE